MSAVTAAFSESGHASAWGRGYSDAGTVEPLPLAGHFGRSIGSLATGSTSFFRLWIVESIFSGSSRLFGLNWSTAAVLPGSAFGRPQRANRIRFSGDPPLRVGCTAPANDGPIAEPAVRRRLGQRGWRSGSAARADLVIEDLAVPPD